MGSSEPLTGLTSEVPRPRALDVRWIHGSESAKHNTDPDIQVHAYDERTFILRQNMAIDYEAPFMFLLFGDTRAVLIDTGATASAEFFPLRRVGRRADRALARAHTRGATTNCSSCTRHAHGDHVAGDAQFAGRPRHRVVGAERRGVWEYFGFGDDRDEVAQCRPGRPGAGVPGQPGHHEAAVTFYDPYDRIPAHRRHRLPRPAVRQGLARIRRHHRSPDRVRRDRPVTHVLGCHIEMTTRPGVDYPVLIGAVDAR